MEKETAALGGRKRSRFGEQMPQHAIPPPQVVSGDGPAVMGAPAAPPPGNAMTPGMYLQV